MSEEQQPQSQDDLHQQLKGACGALCAASTGFAAWLKWKVFLKQREKKKPFA